MAIENNTNGMINVNDKYIDIINELSWGDRDKFEGFASLVIKTMNDYRNPQYHTDLFYKYSEKKCEFIPRVFTTSDIDRHFCEKIPGQTMMKWVRLGLIEFDGKSKKGNLYCLPDDFLVSNDPILKFYHNYSNNF